jgi:PAS domain S-box-containing protein
MSDGCTRERPDHGWARFVGPLLTAALVALIELLTRTPLHLSNPPALLVLAIVLTAFTGGLRPGLISAAIAWAYTAYFFSQPDRPFRFDEEDLRRVALWGMTMPLTAVLVGVLNRRAARALAEAEVAALRQARSEDQARAAEAVRQSEYKLEAAQRMAHVGWWERDLDTDRISWSDETYHILGLMPRGRTLTLAEFQEMIHPKDRQVMERAVGAALAGGPRYDVEYRVVRPSGEVRFVHSQGDITRDDAGRPRRIFGTIQDVTERKRAAEALRESEELYRLLTENSHDLIYLLELDGRIVYTSPSVGRLIGHAPGDKFEVVHPDDLAAAQTYWEHVLAGGTGLFAVRVHDAAGAWHWLESWGSLVDYQGRTRVLSVCRDVTERKQAEEVAKASEERLRLAFEAAKIGTGEMDLQTNQISLSNPMQRVVGLAPGTFKLSFEEWVERIIHPEDRASVRTAVENGVAGPPDIALDYRIVWPDGSVHWVTSRARVFFDEAGRATRIIGAIMDITERKRIEEALRRNDAYLAEAQRLGRTGSWAWDVRTREFVHWSQEHYRLHGLDPQQGTPSWEAVQQFIHPDDRAQCLEQIERAVQARTDCELEYRAVLPDGTIKHIHSISYPVFNAADELVEFIGTEQDVTERKRAEEALRESEAEFRAIFELGVVGQAQGDPQTGRLLRVNRKLCALLGYSEEELLGMNFFQITYPDDLHLDLDLFPRLVSGEIPDYSVDKRIVRKDGSHIWMQVAATMIRDAAGRAVRSLAVGIDITERKRAEEERQAHVWFLESLDRVNRAIQGANDPDQMMRDVLDCVLEIFACDRAWLTYPCNPEAASCRVRMERTRPEYPGGLATGEAFPINPDVTDFMRAVRAADGPVTFGPDGDRPLPVTAGEYGTRSILAMAVSPKGDKPHTFGLHQCSRPRVWTPEERRLFEEVGRRLADALTSLLMYRRMRESEERLAEAQRIAHVGYWDRDVATGLIAWSEETYRIFGLPPEERAQPLPRVLELVHPEDRPRATQAVGAALAGGPRYDVEYRIVRPSGEVRFVHSQGDVTRDDVGRPRRIFGTIQDVTERKRAEEALRASLREKEALLKEVHHRVKNNLQLIISLLSLQAARVGDGSVRSVLADSCDRVRSLALVHENLYRAGQFAGVSLARQVQSLCAQLLRSYGDGARIGLETRVADVSLDLDRAVPLVLITNELVSNALKHAFPGARSGRVLVELRALVPGRYALIVADDGVGLPAEFDLRNLGSLGLQLVSDLADQLHGTVSFHRDSGTTVTITFDVGPGGGQS